MAKAKSTKSTTKKATKKAPKEETETRPVVYPAPTAQFFTNNTQPLDAEQAKLFLGWAVEGEKEKFNADFLIKDWEGKKVRCENNINNRRIYPHTYLAYKQEMLRKRWVLNGESIIIGKTGTVLNGQHQLVALILATQDWETDQAFYADVWPNAPTIEKLVVYGIDEDDATVNTMDTAKPRSLADVIGRSVYFSDLPQRTRNRLAVMLANAVKLLWIRTGTKLIPGVNYMTHPESLNLIAGHTKLLTAAKFINETSGPKNKIAKYVSTGTATALLYLMGSSNTDPTEYQESAAPNEDLLDWSLWEKACDFWTELADGTGALKAVRLELAKLIEDDAASFIVRISLLAKAWLVFLTEKPVTASMIALEFNTTEDDLSVLAELPSVGGIDLGDPSDVDEADIVGDDPSPEEIKKQTAKIRRSNSKHREGVKAKINWGSGDTAWVFDEEGEHYFAKLTCRPYKTADGPHVRVQADDGEWEVRLQNLHLSYPG